MFIKLFPRFGTVLDNEEQPLNKARIRILSTLLLIYTLLFSALSFFYFFTSDHYFLARAGAVSLFLLAIFILLFKGRSWKRLAHAFIWSLTVLVWTNIFIVHQGVNLVTVQFELLIVTCGFYLLGEKRGLFYALLNIFPLLVYILITDYSPLNILAKIPAQNAVAYHITLIFNFAALIYVHYFFFREYKQAAIAEQAQRSQLAQALKAANYTAQEKTNFLATMSHELRTPLNAVIGMTNILRVEKHMDEQNENLDILQFSAENLMAIINDILDFNKIDAGMVELNRVDFRLDKLLENVCGTFSGKATAKGLNFDCNIPDNLSDKLFNGDQTRLIQILFNLVGNAVKFTAEGYVRVKTEIRFDGDHAADVTFRVTDTGIGIPEENLAFIYEPYVQSQARSNRQYHGTGLGLTIAKKLVELLGGELLLHSKESVGTSFQFTLHLEVAELTAISPPGQNQQQKKLGGLKVLVAEDNTINVIIIQKILKSWDIVPVVALNGKLAVDAVRAADFDVILMDINMPVMDGFEASRLIRELPDTAKSAIPIIALTASVGASIEHHQGYQYLNDCILKPFKPDELHALLEKTCL